MKKNIGFRGREKRKIFFFRWGTKKIFLDPRTGGSFQDSFFFVPFFFIDKKIQSPLNVAHRGLSGPVRNQKNRKEKVWKFFPMKILENWNFFTFQRKVYPNDLRVGSFDVTRVLDSIVLYKRWRRLKKSSIMKKLIFPYFWWNRTFYEGCWVE